MCVCRFASTSAKKPFLLLNDKSSIHSNIEPCQSKTRLKKDLLISQQQQQQQPMCQEGEKKSIVYITRERENIVHCKIAQSLLVSKIFEMI